jgi:hypothetical protein
MFLRLSSFLDKPNRIRIPERRGWDGYYSNEIARQRIATSLVSYVEHFGKWGFHNRGNFDRDRALNPTAYLAGIRNETLKKIETGRKADSEALPRKKPPKKQPPKKRLGKRARLAARRKGHR